MKAAFISLGCPKNLVDSEIMLGILEKEGLELTAEPIEAEIIIVNTCAFIDSAKEEAVNTVLDMTELKKKNCRLLIVAGCLAQRYKEEIIKEIPEVDAVIGTGNVSEIGSLIRSLLSSERSVNKVLCSFPDSISYMEDNERFLSDNMPFKYLKISEGCSNHCTYCIIPKLRGEYRSRKIENILKEAEIISNKGCKELVLVAQDVTRYGEDLYGRPRLTQLLYELSKLDNIKWIRILYSYPERITNELIEGIKNNSKVCNYFDIPVQHASNRILKKMGRKSSIESIMDILSKIRSEIPNVVLRTSLITGFPGETEEDFNILKDFVLDIEFDRLGVFAYSREEGTPAAKMKNQIPEDIKNRRRDSLMEIQKSISLKKNEKKLGKVYETLVHGVADDGIFYIGRSYAEAPEIDPVIYFTSPEPLKIGDFVEVKILNVQDYDLIGEVVG